MWGAIIQAIDHAMQRTHDGAGAGIKVANSQHGGGAPISKMDSGAGEAVKQGLGNQQETTPKQEEATEQSKIGNNPASTGANAGGQAEGGAGALGSIGVGTERAGAGDSEGIGSSAGAESAGAESAGTESGGAEAAGAESAGASGGIAGAASSILSDENAKTSKPVSKFQSMRAYGANAGKGFANAGAIATGSKAAEWKDIDNSLAKKAAEDTVKGWRKKDFKADSTNK